MLIHSSNMPDKLDFSSVFIRKKSLRIWSPDENISTPITRYLAASSLLLEFFHIRVCHSPAKDLQSAQSSHITASIVFNKDCYAVHPLELYILERNGLRILFHFGSGKMNRLGGVHVFAVLKSKILAIDIKVDLCGVQFRIDSIVELCKLDRVNLLLLNV